MTGSPSRRAVIGALGVATALARKGAQAGAQGPGWQPRQPVRVIVGFAAGTSADRLARYLAVPLSESLGVPVVVENRPGAGGSIGLEAVARAEPDGQVVGMGGPEPLAIHPALASARPQFDPARSLTPVIHLTEQPNVLLTSPGLPADGLSEFRAWALAHPQEPFASPGSGTSHHLTGLAIARALRAQWRHVPDGGRVSAHADLLAGRLRLMVDDIATALPLIRDGRMKAALVSTAERSPLLPQVPSFTELGIPGLASWQGILGPAGLPAPVLARLNAAFAAALASPAVAEWLREAGATSVAGPPERFAAFLAAERLRWAALVGEHDVKVN